jgi:hypothetical protein
MFESYNVRSEPPASAALRVIHKAENLYFLARNVWLAGGSLKFFAEKLRIEVSRFNVHCAILWEKIVDRFHPGRGVSYPHLRILDANHQAQKAYQPVPYDGRLTLFKPKVHYRKFNNPSFGWESVAMQGIQIVEMPNYPRGSLNQPFVGVLASRLTTEIERTLQPQVMRPTATTIVHVDSEQARNRLRPSHCAPAS